MTAAAVSNAHAVRAERNRARARSGTERGSAPVRRGSVSAEEPDRHTRNLSLAERRHLLRSIEAWAEAERGKQGVAPLTASTLHIADVMLFRLMDRTTGRLDDAISWIAHASKRAYQTVVEAIAQLEAHGILAVLRRCRRGDGPEAPPWVQDTNLYRFELPPKVRDWWVKRKATAEEKRRARRPDDVDHHVEAAAAANAAQEEDLFAWQAAAVKAARRAEDLARDVRGPGAAAWRATLDGS